MKQQEYTRLEPPVEQGTILMVDDNDVDRLMAQRCYDKSSLTNPFLTVPSGEELIRFMDEVEAGTTPMPLVVLLDINMPGISGFDALSEVRRRPLFSEVPAIVMLTNSDSPKDRERAADLGANRFQTKPSRVHDYVEFFNSLMEVR